MDYIRTPQDAERNAAIRMRELGFSDSEVTTGGADGGVDVISGAALAQVKWRGGVVGRPEIQNLYGARGVDTSRRLLFFAASGYSAHAIEYAEATDVALFTYEPDGRISAVNDHAERLLVGGRSLASVPSAPAASVGQSVWMQAILGFLKKHWRIICAVIAPTGIPVGISTIISPTGTDTRADGVGILVLSLILTPIFWGLYVNHRRNS